MYNIVFEACYGTPKVHSNSACINIVLYVCSRPCLVEHIMKLSWSLYRETNINLCGPAALSFDRKVKSRRCEITILWRHNLSNKKKSNPARNSSKYNGPVCAVITIILLIFQVFSGGFCPYNAKIIIIRAGNVYSSVILRLEHDKTLGGTVRTDCQYKMRWKKETSDYIIIIHNDKWRCSSSR